MKTKIIFSLLILPCLLFSQLRKLDMPDFHSDADIYSDGSSLYSNTFTVEFAQTVINLPQSQTETSIEALPAQFADLRSKLMHVRSRYGLFKLVKVVISAKPGETILTNKRTGALVVVPDLSQIFALKFQNPVLIDSLIDYLRTVPEIVNVKGPRLFLKFISPNDEKYTQGLQWNLSAVSAPQAWDITTGSTTIKVAVVDEGVNQSHPDLAGKFVGGSGGSGEHGTWVAGVAGAQTNNSIGVASLGWNVRLMNYDWDLIDPVDAIYRAGDSADVINMSWGSFRFATLQEIPSTCGNPSKWIYPNAIFPAVVPDADPFLQQAINYALQRGVVCIAAAGNTSVNLNNPAECDPAPIPFVSYPAAFDGVIAVSGTQLISGTERFVDIWNFNPAGIEWLDLSAPGWDILTTDIGGGYLSVPGTSFSSPLVASLCGLILSMNPNLTSAQVRAVIASTADKIDSDRYPYNGNGWNSRLGYGRINAYRALKYTLENYGGTITQMAVLSANESWTFSPGVTIKFTAGAGLNLLGSVSMSGNSSLRVNFSKNDGEDSWQGITFNGAHNSSLQYCDINYATMPIKATNTTNLTISNVTIGNSSFYNGCDNAAMAFYNSSPSISYTTINGQSNSWNGIRFAQGSTGIIQYSTIQNCGAGNGIGLVGDCVSADFT